MCFFFSFKDTSLFQGHNIFSSLSSRDYGDLMQLLKQSILATDLTLYFEWVLLSLHVPSFIESLYIQIVNTQVQAITFLAFLKSIWFFSLKHSVDFHNKGKCQIAELQFNCKHMSIHLTPYKDPVHPYPLTKLTQSTLKPLTETTNHH